MTPSSRIAFWTPLYALLLLAVSALPIEACLAQGDRGLETVHQPVVTAAGAGVPGCGEWRGMSRDSAATTDSNFGCAVNGNLAAMIADPQDLLRGKSDGNNGAEATRAYKMWYESVPTGAQPLERVSTKAGGQ